MALPWSPAVLLLGQRARDIKTYIHIKTCTQVFIALLLIIAPNWKQLKFLTTNEWINKMQHIHAMEYYSARKRNEVLKSNIVLICDIDASCKHYAK